MNKATFINYKVENLKTKVIGEKTLQLSFTLVGEGFTHKLLAFNDNANELVKLFNEEKYPELVCGITAYRVGVKHPDTNEVLTDSNGKQILMTACMFCVEEIK